MKSKNKYLSSATNLTLKAAKGILWKILKKINLIILLSIF